MKKLFILLSVSSILLTSCSDDANEDIGIEQQLTQTELQTIVTTDEVTSAVDTALAELYNFDSSTNKSFQKTNECYSAEYSETGFTATFNNCVLNGTDNVNGTLVVVYGVNDNTISYTATFEDFYVGYIKVNGSRTYTLNTSSNVEAISFTIVSNITVEFEDGETIVENGNKTFAIVFEEGQDTLWNLSGNWTLQLDGNTYTISGDVSRTLICQYWTTGEMQINKNGLQVEVDFGDGTCDDKAMLSYPNGTSEEITL